MRILIAFALLFAITLGEPTATAGTRQKIIDAVTKSERRAVPHAPIKKTRRQQGQAERFRDMAEACSNVSDLRQWTDDSKRYLCGIAVGEREPRRRKK